MNAASRYSLIAIVGVCLAADWRVVGDRSLPATQLIVSVGDAGTGAFVADAQVRLPSVGRVARTQWNGEARFPGLSNGKYRIQVRAIGYAPSDIEMPISGDSAGIYFALERVPASLDTVKVAERRPARGMAEFEDRRRMGIGRFITDSILRDDRTRSLQWLLVTRIPGLSVYKRTVVEQGPKGPCPILLYLDGFELREIGPSGLDDLRTDDLSGIEVYDRVAAPAQYRPLGSYCKVVLLWSRW